MILFKFTPHSAPEFSLQGVGNESHAFCQLLQHIATWQGPLPAVAVVNILRAAADALEQLDEGEEFGKGTHLDPAEPEDGFDIEVTTIKAVQ